MITFIFKQTTTTTTSTITPVGTTTETTTIIGEKKMKCGMCIGLNRYPNPSNNLAGCLNDMLDFSALLKDVYKFDVVKTLSDSDATYNNFVNMAKELLAMKPDVFVITNSSHGTRVNDTTGTESDGYCEAICLYDKFLIDHDFHKILENADPKTRITVVSDSCHSAGVTREFLAVMNDFTYVSTPKYLPPEDNMEALRVSMMPISKAIFEPKENMNEALIAGCKSSEYSYDASFNVNGTMRPNGAFTYYCIKTLKETPEITYKDFINKMNQFLPSNQYPQCPVLQCNSATENKLMFE
jgi:hypothetical protein